VTKAMKQNRGVLFLIQ